uniref:ATP-dependent RNA helicase DHX29-like UBA domain-containing protein n=1 Tax=Periophthalmus magnuspinnatus TaxID=409849 RepID=A0A3B3ZEH4_9GOBI
MGGKKKKSAAAAAPAAPPAAPAAPPAATSRTSPASGSTSTEEQKGKTSNRPSKQAQDNKSKGSQCSLFANYKVSTNKYLSYLVITQVSIQADLEKKIIRLINDFRQEYADKGPISGRLTTKKLLDLYIALEKFNFKKEHIEESMKSSVLYGGDLHSALDWLCLNLKDDELPGGFCQQMQEESQKNRPKFQLPVQQKPSTISVKPPQNTNKEAKDEAAVVKNWILRYADQSSDDDDEEEEEENGDKSSRNPELDEKFDPVSVTSCDLYFFII